MPESVNETITLGQSFMFFVMHNGWLILGILVGVLAWLGWVIWKW